MLIMSRPMNSPFCFARGLCTIITFCILANCNPLIAQKASSENWNTRYNSTKAQEAFEVSTMPDGFTFKSSLVDSKNLYAYCHTSLVSPIKSLKFEFKSTGNAVNFPIILLDAAANELWRFDGQGEVPATIELKNLKVNGQIIFKIGTSKILSSAAEVGYSISGVRYSLDEKKAVVDEEGFTTTDDITELRGYASQDNIKVRLKPGYYQVDKAFCKQFIQFTGNNSVYDMRGVNIMVDTKLFARTDLSPGLNDGRMYCAIGIHGNNIQMDGVYVETYGDTPGMQSRNKIFNLTGTDVTLKNAEVRTSGSNPWGYGSFYGLGGGDVRKMNGIRIAWPGKNIKLIGCKVHMRAMGHAIFIQGAKNTLIEDCHVDGLLRTTDDILSETSGYAFDKGFKAGKGGYIEGVIVAKDKKYLPGEMFSLSEDGIRIYPQAQRGADTATGSTTIKNCTVTNMRRGICTGLNSVGDKVINCQVTNCYAAGFNVGNDDILINCSADAKYAEAFCITKSSAKNASVDIKIVDSRGGMKNNLLASINGTGHKVIIKTSNNSFIPESLAIELSTLNGYAYYQRSGVRAMDIQLNNQTQANVILLPGAENNEIKSKGEVIDQTSNGSANETRGKK